MGVARRWGNEQTGSKGTSGTAKQVAARALKDSRRELGRAASNDIEGAGGTRRLGKECNRSGKCTKFGKHDTPFLDRRRPFMPYQDTRSVTPRDQIQLRFAKRASKLVSTYQCLIVSADSKRRDMLERAAMEGGWKTLLCADASTALTMVNRSLVQLAIVDLESQRAESLRPVVERFQVSNGLLLIVCGNEGDVEEEVWVRQLGTWLYLPGVVDDGNLSLLCGEARQIAERLSQSKVIPRPNGQAAQRSNQS
jgi:ActR/RegA family two-component response regulator